MWILGSIQRETSFIYLPGIIAVIIAILFPDIGEASIIYGFLALALIGQGHIYTTAWRTFFYNEERTSSPIYWTFPLSFFLLFSVWHYSKLPGLWSFVVYVDLFHHVRQFYGFSKWYQTLNQRQDKISDKFLYALIILPAIIYHFRPGAMASYYSQQDLFLYPNENIRDALLIVYVLILTTWLLYELSLWKKGIREVNRLVSVAFPVLIYGFCFLIAKTMSQVLFPLLLIHGIAYFGVMGQTLHRTQQDRFKSQKIALIVVILTAIFFGFAESWYEENLVLVPRLDNPVLSAVIIGISLTPLFCHYAFDAVIWKRNHRESATVLKSTQDR